MPARTVIHKERRLLITTPWGRLTFQEMRAHQDELLSNPNSNPSFDELIDFQE